MSFTLPSIAGWFPTQDVNNDLAHIQFLCMTLHLQSKCHSNIIPVLLAVKPNKGTCHSVKSLLIWSCCKQL